MSVCGGAAPHEPRLGARTQHLLLVVDLLNERSQSQEALQGGVHVASLRQVGEPSTQQDRRTKSQTGARFLHHVSAAFIQLNLE